MVAGGAADQPDADPFEWYDPAGQVSDWGPARRVELEPAHAVRRFEPRTTPPASGEPIAFPPPCSVRVVEPLADGMVLDVLPVLYPGLDLMGGATARPFALATRVRVGHEWPLRTPSIYWDLHLDGRRLEAGRDALAPGEHLLWLTPRSLYQTERQSPLDFLDPRREPELALGHPLDPESHPPFMVVVFSELLHVDSDTR